MKTLYMLQSIPEEASDTDQPGVPGVAVELSFVTWQH